MGSEGQATTMKLFIVSVRWTVTVALLLAFGIAATNGPDGISSVAIFATNAGSVIGASLLVPRYKWVVALLTFGIGLTASVNLFRITPDRLFTAIPSVFHVSFQWKESACGCHRKCILDRIATTKTSQRKCCDHFLREILSFGDIAMKFPGNFVSDTSVLGLPPGRPLGHVLLRLLPRQLWRHRRAWKLMITPVHCSWPFPQPGVE
jgi:hypothetical protein